MPKGNSGVARSRMKAVARKMKADAKQGIISMNISQGLSLDQANELYELIDKNYPMLEGYRYTDLGIGGYNYYHKTSQGEWRRVNDWHEPYPDYIRTDSAKRGFVKLQIYGAAGRVKR